MTDRTGKENRQTYTKPPVRKARSPSIAAGTRPKATRPLSQKNWVAKSPMALGCRARGAKDKNEKMGGCKKAEKKGGTDLLAQHNVAPTPCDALQEVLEELRVVSIFL